MKDPNRLTVQSPELLAQQSLVQPNGLEQSFRRRILVLMQD